MNSTIMMKNISEIEKKKMNQDKQNINLMTLRNLERQL